MRVVSLCVVLLFFLQESLPLKATELVLCFPKTQKQFIHDLLVVDYQNISAKQLSDSSVLYSYPLEKPEYFLILVQVEASWVKRVWMDPGVTSRTLDINFEKKTVRLRDENKTDLLLETYDRLINTEQQDSANRLAEQYIRQNRSAYLSLWFLGHGTYHGQSAKQAALLNTLAPELSAYKEYRQLKNNLSQRRVPVSGEVFREFSLENAKGEFYSTQNIKNKVIVLHFWSNTCAPCVKGMDALVKYHSGLDTALVQFISISLDKEKAEWQTSKTSAKITWVSLWQADDVYGELCLHYNLNAMPLFITFSKNKTLNQSIEGEDLYLIKKEVEELLLR